MEMSPNSTTASIVMKEEKEQETANSKLWEPLECFYQKQESNWCIKISFRLKNKKPLDVFNVLVNYKNNFPWFTKEKESLSAEKLDENHDIYYSICRSDRSPYRSFRFMLLRYFDSDKRKQTHRVLMSSVANYDGIIHNDSITPGGGDVSALSASPMGSPVPLTPLNKLKGTGGTTPTVSGSGNTSSRLSTSGSDRHSQEEDFDHFDIMLPSGFEVSPMKDDNTSTKVSLYWQLTGGSVLLFSADLLDESKELRQSVYNIVDLVYKK